MLSFLGAAFFVFMVGTFLFVLSQELGVFMEGIWDGIVNGFNRFGYYTGKAIGRVFYSLRWPRL